MITTPVLPGFRRVEEMLLQHQGELLVRQTGETSELSVVLKHNLALKLGSLT